MLLTASHSSTGQSNMRSLMPSSHYTTLALIFNSQTGLMSLPTKAPDRAKSAVAL